MGITPAQTMQATDDRARVAVRVRLSRRRRNGISAAGAYWLARTLVQHKLNRDIENYKSELARQLDAQKTLAAQDLERLKNTLQLEQSRIKATMDAQIRMEVEAQLGELAVQRQYEYEARRRLYTAIGPLRFQLLLACRDRRIVPERGRVPGRAAIESEITRTGRQHDRRLG